MFSIPKPLRKHLLCSGCIYLEKYSVIPSSFIQAVMSDRLTFVMLLKMENKCNSYDFTHNTMLCFYLSGVSLCSYVMSNGYKPAPLELSDVKLTAGQEVLVDKLAENAHNVWAKDRIKQGWTYGIQQVNIAPPLSLKGIGNTSVWS